MKVVDAYKQYLGAQCIYNEVERKGVVVTLTATSDNGNIRYEVGLSFFPYRDPEDFVISYDACISKEIFAAKGRRSKKREEAFLKDLPEYADAFATELEGIIFWDKPLREAVRG